MSIRTVQSSALAPRHTAVAARSNQGAINNTTSPWVRNPSWLPLPAVGNTEQKFVGLFAVWPQANFLALSAAGDYTVDWGDGVTENVATGVQANHEYDFADVDIANTNAPVTFQDTGDTVTRTAHGYTNGMTISFNSITTTTGIVAGQFYFVVNATANTFQVSATSGGAALALTTDGSGIILPYKQVIVTITPQAGQNLTSLNLNLRNSRSGLQGYASGWLDILVSGPNLTALTISASSPLTPHRYLEQAQLISSNNIASFTNIFNGCAELRSVPIWTVRASGAVNMTSMFSGCSSLQTVPLFNTAAVTDMSSMFIGCSSLQAVPLFNTVAVTSMSSMFNNCGSLQAVPLFNTVVVFVMNNMFNGCSSLQTVPLFNTTIVQSMSQMFQSCSSLQTVPLFNIRTTGTVDMSSMFSGCSSLQTVPLFNTQAVTSMSQMFSSCLSLQTVPLFNTAAVTDMGQMFSGCSSLQTVPLFNTQAVTSMFNMFSGCSSLQTVPLFNTQAVTSMGQMFQSCSSLQTVPLFNTAIVQSMSSMFSGCSSLQAVPALVTTAGTSSTSFSGMFSSCSSLTRIEAKNFNFTFSISSCKLSKTAIEEIFTNLPTVATTQTITVGSNTNFGAPSVISLSGTTTSGSTTVTMASTTNLVVGMQTTGTGISTAVAVTMQDTGDTVTRTAHGIANDTPVSFATIVTTTGIVTFTPYFVVNATANTFQLALTVGGAAIALTTDGSGTLLYGVTITAITPNTSITLSIPASASGTVTTSSALLQRSIARLKNWTVA